MRLNRSSVSPLAEILQTLIDVEKTGLIAHRSASPTADAITPPNPSNREVLEASIYANQLNANNRDDLTYVQASELIGALEYQRKFEIVFTSLSGIIRITTQMQRSKNQSRLVVIRGMNLH